MTYQHYGLVAGILSALIFITVLFNSYDGFEYFDVREGATTNYKKEKELTIDEMQKLLPPGLESKENQIDLDRKLKKLSHSMNLIAKLPKLVDNVKNNHNKGK